MTTRRTPSCWRHSAANDGAVLSSPGPSFWDNRCGRGPADELPEKHHDFVVLIPGVGGHRTRALAQVALEQLHDGLTRECDLPDAIWPPNNTVGGLAIEPASISLLKSFVRLDVGTQ